jgi:hypothetical protein
VPEEVVTYNEAFERAVSNLKYVTKIAFMLYIEDITEKRRLIEAKKTDAQSRLAKERDTSKKSEPLKIELLEREVSAWNLQLEELSKGPKPMGLLAYAMTSAVGTSREEAIAAVRAQANELRTTLRNALNVEIEILDDNNMLRCFEWELYYPASASDFEQLSQ